MKRTLTFVLFLSTLGGATFAGNVGTCNIVGFAITTTSGCTPVATTTSSNSLTTDGSFNLAATSSGVFLSQTFVTTTASTSSTATNPWASSTSSTATNPWAVNTATATSAVGFTSFLSAPTATQAANTGFGFSTGSTTGFSAAPSTSNTGFSSSAPSFLSQGAANFGATFSVSSTILNFGTSGQSTSFNTGLNTGAGTNAVPEPGTMLLMGMGLVAVGALARRRRKS